MVYPGYDSAIDEFNKLHDNRIRNELEQENAILRAAQLTKLKLKNKLPKLESTRVLGGEDSTRIRIENSRAINILSEIGTYLHQIMNASDAAEALKFLEENSLIDAFYDQIDRFKKYFAGVKRISLGQFQNYFEQSSNRNGLLLEQQIQSDRPLQDKADQLASDIEKPMIESVEMEAKREVKINPSPKLKQLKDQLITAHETIAQIDAVEPGIKNGSTTRLKNLLSKVNDIAGSIKSSGNLPIPEISGVIQKDIKEDDLYTKKQQMLSVARDWTEQLANIISNKEADEIEGYIRMSKSKEIRQGKIEESKRRSEAHSQGLKHFYSQSHASVRSRHANEPQIVNRLKVLLGELSVGNRAVIQDIKKLINTMHDSDMISSHEYSVLTQKLSHA